MHYLNYILIDAIYCRCLRVQGSPLLTLVIITLSRKQAQQSQGLMFMANSNLRVVFTEYRFLSHLVD